MLAVVGVVLATLGVVWLLMIPILAWMATNGVTVPWGLRDHTRVPVAEGVSRRVSRSMADGMRRSWLGGVLLLAVGIALAVAG